jgi:hypothetical protein
LMQSRVAASEAGGGSKVSPASPVATTPKIALDKSVHVRELKCAVCGGPFTDTHIETTNGQRWAPLHAPQFCITHNLSALPSPHACMQFLSARRAMER